jgi:hypothetical protein
MIPSAETLPRKSRLAALLDHFSRVEDPDYLEALVSSRPA